MICMGKKQTDEAPQVTLKTFFEEDNVTKTYHIFRTEFHEIRMTNTRVETFLRSIKKNNKAGPVNTREEQHMKMCEFVITKARPLVQKMHGVEWEASIRSLLKKVFKEDFDRDDFDNKMLEQDATSPKINA